MKKIGLIFLMLVTTLTIYYVTFGSSYMTREMKKRLDTEIVKLQHEGFIVKDRTVEEKREHFVIVLNDSKKASQIIEFDNLNVLEGIEFGVDIEYLSSIKDAMSVDIYPVKLSGSKIYEILKEDRQETVQKLEKMVANKDLLLHVNINKLFNGFDGFLKDIKLDEFVTEKLNFDGKLTRNKTIDGITVHLKHLLIKENSIDMEVENLEVDYESPDNNTLVEYKIGKLGSKSRGVNKDFISTQINSIYGKFDEVVNKNGSLRKTTLLDVESAEHTSKNEKNILKNLKIVTTLDNIDADALSKLENMLKSGGETTSISEIVSKDISLKIDELSISDITSNNKSIGGFKIDGSAKFNQNKSFNWDSLEDDPYKLLELIDAKVNLEVSDEIMNLASKTPQAVMMLMFIQPIDKDGKKIFHIEYKNGSFKVNGKPLI